MRDLTQKKAIRRIFSLGICIAMLILMIQSSNIPQFINENQNEENNELPIKFDNPKSSGEDDLLYSTFLGGLVDETQILIATDNYGNIHLTTTTASLNLPTTSNCINASNNGGNDIYYAIFAPNNTGLIYATYLGGNGYDSATRLILDEFGNAYISGMTYSTNYPTTLGAYDTVFNGGDSDVFVTKFDATGENLIFSTFIGGSNRDWGHDIVLAQDGSIYVSGQVLSSDFPTTAGAYDTAYSGDTEGDCFISRLSSDGSTLLNSTFLGGTSFESGVQQLEIDSNGNIIGLAGVRSSGWPITGNAWDNSFGGGTWDNALIKMNPTLSSLIYSSYVGGNNNDYLQDMFVDSMDYVYLTGHTSSSDFPTTAGVIDRTFTGSYKNVVMKFNPDNSLNFSTYIGGNAETVGTAIKIDGDKNIYILGYTSSTDYPTIIGAVDRDHNGGTYDGTFSIINHNGTELIYSTFIGGDDEDKGNWANMALLSNGDICMGYETKSTNFPTTIGAYNTSHNGGKDIGLVFLRSPLRHDILVQNWNHTWGSENKNCYLRGSWKVGNYLYVSGSIDNGTKHIYLAKYNLDGTEVWNRSIGSDPTLAIGYDVWANETAVYVAGGIGQPAFLFQYDTNGNQIWNQTWTGSYYVYAYGVYGVDNVVFVCGYRQTSEEAFLIKYDGGGNKKWEKNYNLGLGITFTAVWANSTTILTTGSYTVSGNPYPSDTVLYAFNQNGDLLFNKYFGSSIQSTGQALWTDEKSCIYLFGSTNGYGAGNYDFLIVKYDILGNYLWNRTWGGTGLDMSMSGHYITDGAYFYLAGCTESYGSGAQDSVMIKIDMNGNQLWNITWGGTGNDEAKDIFQDQNTVYTVGYTTVNSYQKMELIKWTIPVPNVAPVILGNIQSNSNWTQNEDFGTFSIDFTSNESDVEDSGSNLDWYITGLNTALVTVTGENSSDDVLTFHSVANAFGVDTFRLWLIDSDKAVDYIDITITINSINDAPVILGDIQANPIWSQSLNFGQFSIDFTSNESDIEDFGSNLDWYITGLNTGLVTVTGENSSDDVLTFHSVPNQVGVDTFRLWLNDSQSGLDYIDITITISDDITPPTGSIAINSGDLWTNSISVTLSLTYSDGLGSGIDLVRYSNDGIWDTEVWESPVTTKVWNLPMRNGIQVVYYQIRDNSGNLAVYSDSINLDTVAPVFGEILLNHQDISEDEDQIVSCFVIDPNGINGSGLATQRLYFKIDDEDWNSANFISFSENDAMIDASLYSAYQIFYYYLVAIDDVGNVNYKYQIGCSSSINMAKENPYSFIVSPNDFFEHQINLINPQNTTYTNSFIIPLSYTVNFETLDVLYLLDGEYYISGTNESMTIDDFADTAEFFTVCHSIKVIVWDIRNVSYSSNYIWFTVKVENKLTAELTMRLEIKNITYGGLHTTYQINITLINSGAINLKSIRIYLNANPNLYNIIGPHVIALRQLNIGESSNIIFRIEHIAKSRNPVLRLEVVSEGYKTQKIQKLLNETILPETIIIIFGIMAGISASATITIPVIKKKITDREIDSKVLKVKGKTLPSTFMENKDEPKEIVGLKPSEIQSQLDNVESKTKMETNIADLKSKPEKITVQNNIEHKLKHKSEKPDIQEYPKEIDEFRKQEIEKTEAEVSIDKNIDICTVCKGHLTGDVFVCPNCKNAKYHRKCLVSLSENKDTCWVCSKPFSTEAEAQKLKMKAIQLNNINKILEDLDIQYKRKEISLDELVELTTPYIKQKEELKKEIDLK